MCPASFTTRKVNGPSPLMMPESTPLATQGENCFCLYASDRLTGIVNQMPLHRSIIRLRF